MSTTLPSTQLQLRSLVRTGNELEVSLADVAVPLPAAGEVLVRIDAAPINPSDLGLLFSAADMGQARFSGSPGRPVVTAPIAEAAMKGLAGRLDESMPVGNEGAGTVVATGDSPEAKALLGKTVAIIGGATYAQYRAVAARDVLVLKDGATAIDGASSFVNPLTALGMVETMRREGHTALVHTAAASNLGQMLNRICIADGVELVNIVRKPEQAELLRAIGAKHVVDQNAESFKSDLLQAIVATGATLAFDAIGGGKLASQILTAMEQAINLKATAYSRYGSNTLKQVYLYGALDMGPVEVVRNFGMAWGMGGWLLFPFLQKCGAETAVRLKQRVADELTTTFASSYVDRLSLAEALTPAAIAVYNRRATGAKVLIEPNRV